MWNPFARREVRASYTDALVSLLVREASGSGAPTGQAHATAAVEACASMWSHAFAAARLEPKVPALSPPALADISRRLILDGEAVYVIDVSSAGLRLLPVGSLNVRGQSPDPATWSYECTLNGPDASTTRTVPSAGVVHIRASVDPSKPWRGISGLRRAGLDADLLSSLVTRLKEESGAPVAHVIPSPADGQSDATTALRSDLKAAKGGVVLAETMARGYGDKAASPMQDWAVRRIGANPPDVLRALASETGQRIMKPAQCRVRSWSQARTALASAKPCAVGCTAHVAPLGRIVAAELSDKLAVPGLTMGFEAQYGSDIVGRASAFKRLVEGGMAIEKAVALAGLVAADE